MSNRILEKHSSDPSDAVHAAAFRARLAPIARFVSEMNQHMEPRVSLLAVRDGTKFDFVLKDGGGKVVGIAQPIVASNMIRGIHLQTTRLPHVSCEFALDAAGVASAADMVSVAIGQEPPPPGIAR